MDRRLKSCSGFAAGAMAALVVFVASSASADVTIKRSTVIKGLGGMMNSTVTSTEMVQGDMMASDNETKMDSKLMKLMGAGKPIKTSSIIRLDKGVIWDIKHKEKSYTEMTLAQMRQMMDSLGAMMSNNSETGQQGAAFDTSEYKLLPPKIDVKRTGKHETISGYDCEEALLTMETAAVHRKKGDTVLLDVTMSSMLAKNVPGEAERTAFGQKMAQAMGMDMSAAAGQSMQKMLSMYGLDADKLAEEAKKLEGFAMRTEMSFSMGGSAMEKAAEGQEESKGQEDTKDEESAKADETSSDDLASKALGGLFGKKKKGEPKEEAGSKSGDLPPGAMFTVVSTVTEIGTGSVAATSFEVPAGYKLKTE